MHLKINTKRQVKWFLHRNVQVDPSFRPLYFCFCYLSASFKKLFSGYLFCKQTWTETNNIQISNVIQNLTVWFRLLGEYLCADDNGRPSNKVNWANLKYFRWSSIQVFGCFSLLSYCLLEVKYVYFSAGWNNILT